MSELDYFNNNLKHLINKKGITQKKLSELTHVSPASINNMINKNADPSVEFLLALKREFGIDLDEFLTDNITEEIRISPEGVSSADFKKLSKFEGSFIMYFYNSSEYKGKVSTYSKNTLKYCVISVIPRSKEEKIFVIANFVKSRDFAEELKQKLDNCINNEEKEALHRTCETPYTGKLEASESQIFIYLKSKEANDQSLLIFNNPPSNKIYIGGLGTANSVSRGREHMPCVQFVLLSKKILRVPDGEIYNLLALGTSDVNVETEAEQMINLFKSLYINTNNLKDELTELQKKKVFENSFTNILIELIDANMFRFAKVSNMEDDDYYRMIKDN